jgi:predicted DsbA family dithiol-disulfide isomerase
VAVIEVFADVWCPFTHVGLRRFVQTRAEMGRDVHLRVRAWPLELINGQPLDPGFVAEEVTELQEQVAPDLFRGFDEAGFPTSTLPALRLTASAYERDLALGERVALDLRHRLFERGQDIAAAAVLSEVTAAHGLPEPDDDDDGPEGEDPVEADWAEGRARSVTGSPHFFTPAGDFFCPSLEVQKVDGHLRITADPEGFDRFVRACLEGDRP